MEFRLDIHCRDQKLPGEEGRLSVHMARLHMGLKTSREDQRKRYMWLGGKKVLTTRAGKEEERRHAQALSKTYCPQVEFN
uniref:Uncharacterized protein n=1 Tax=Utricularia reniformis TaxID=192314 RepID=A0A1Y0AYU0_9LAMI|nr:hypothetical protein AEK19_MT0880 [Utricularia reniformis]ART30323.1 hypothetical protein AEK19_MT0880 [Utricularia reniformis]